MRKLRLSFICIIIAIVMLLNTKYVYADEVKIVTIGADLTDEQKQLMLNYFGVIENEVEIVTVTNADEHKYLDGIATQQQIGTHTYSCSYIEPTIDGGIHVQTANLNWVTCEMIRNALITSGITNCNIVCAAPKEVSGTGALTGIFVAYQQVTGQELDQEKVEIASEELIMTADLATEIGQDVASDLFSTVKEEVITSDITSEEDVKAVIEKYLSDNNIQITQEQLDKLIDLLLKLAEQDYNVEDIKNAYSELKQTIGELHEQAEETRNFFQKIADFFKNLFNSNEDVEETPQGSIFDNIDTSLLGENAIVTATDAINTIKDEANTKIEEEKAKGDDSIFTKIANFFKNLFSSKDDEDVNNPEPIPVPLEQNQNQQNQILEQNNQVETNTNNNTEQGINNDEQQINNTSTLNEIQDNSEQINTQNNNVTEPIKTYDETHSSNTDKGLNSVTFDNSNSTKSLNELTQ